MKILSKINSLNNFLSKAEFTKLVPVLTMLNEMPENTINNINSGINDYPKQITKDALTIGKYYTNSDEEKIEICKMSGQIKNKSSAIEKIAIYRKSNFYNPQILNYSLISDNKYETIEFEVESMNKEEVKLRVIASTQCPAHSKLEENNLISADYVFKAQKFFDESKYCGYKFGGNIYYSQPTIISFTLTHEKFNKLVCQSADITFEK